MPRILNSQSNIYIGQAINLTEMCLLKKTADSFQTLSNHLKQQENKIIDILVDIRKNLALFDTFGNECLDAQKQLNQQWVSELNAKDEQYKELLAMYNKLQDRKNVYKSKLREFIVNQSCSDSHTNQKETKENYSNEKHCCKFENSSGTIASTVIVAEEEDEEYFEISHKRKTPPSNKDQPVEVPDTICESQPSPIQDQPNKRRRTSPNLKADVLKLMQPQDYLSSSECSSNRKFGNHINDRSPLLISNSALKEIASQVEAQTEVSKELRKDRIVLSLKEAKESKLNKDSSKLKVRDINTLLDSPSKSLIKGGNVAYTFVETDKTRCTFIEEGKEQQTEDKDETQLSHENDSGSETLFVKPDKNKWKLKVTGRFSQSKLKQTQLGFQKESVKIDVSNIPILDNKAEPDSNQIQKVTKDMREHAPLVIEDTLLESEEESDKNINNTELMDRDLVLSKRTSIESLPDDSMFLPPCMSTQVSAVDKQTMNKSKSSVDITPISKSNKKTSVKSTDEQSTSSCKKSSKREVRSAQKQDVDFTSEWKCGMCKDYFISTYGMKILKIRPPPKRCGHKHRLPATPPDFWDAMCT